MKNYLATGRLGEPESPLVLERMLHIKVVLVVENGHGLAVVLGFASVLLAVRRDGNGGQVDLLVHIGGFGRGRSHD